MRGEPGRSDSDTYLFSPRSQIWTVNRETALALAAGCAILMQFAHPLVAAAVDQHSSFRTEPLLRFRRTRDLTLDLVFGQRDQVLAAARTINSLHERVKGESGLGSYSAKDPDLLLWVHATLLYSQVMGYRNFVAPLSDQEANNLYRQNRSLGPLLGVPTEIYPVDWQAFLAYIAAMVQGGGLCVDDRARRLAQQALHPTIPWVPGLAFAPIVAVTAGLLPPALRRGFGLPWNRRTRATFRVARVVVPPLVRRLPGTVRYHPQARRALRPPLP